MAKQQKPTIVAPVVQVGPLGELRIYPITESELDELERGSPASIHLNFALLFWGIAATLIVAILTTSIQPDRRYYAFVIAAFASVGVAIVFSVLRYISVYPGLSGPIRACSMTCCSRRSCFRFS